MATTGTAMEALSGAARGCEGPWMGSCLEGQLRHNVLHVSLSALPQNINKTIKTCLKTNFVFWKLIQIPGI